MDPDEVRDAIAQAVMDQGQGAEGNTGKYYGGEMDAPSPGKYYGGEMDVGSSQVSDRDVQIARNAAPPSFMGMPPIRELNSAQKTDLERQMQETAKAAQDPFLARPAPAQAAPMPAPRGPNSPPLPQWVGKFAPPSYPYGRR